jgi:hypothetical protein
MTSSNVVGLLEIRIDKLPSELSDGLHEVELQRVLVPIFDLQLGPSHVDVTQVSFPSSFSLLTIFQRIMVRILEPRQ